MSVSRLLGTVFVLMSLAVLGWLFALQSRSEGPTSRAATQAEAQAVSAAALSDFSQAGEALQATFQQTGTYIGAQLPDGSGVTLASTTATSYCLEASINGTLMHEAGPGGSPATGSC
jgi:ferric-dicitrate binding protein FerR (iron transport regulator)